MAGIFLTPAVIWKNFKIKDEIKSEVLKEYYSDDIAFMHLRIEGRTVSDGTVGIYGVIVRKAQLNFSPAVVIVQDFKDGTDLTLGKFFAEKGYMAFVVDIGGKNAFNAENNTDGIGKPYTVYPDSLNYADFDEKENSRSDITLDASATCWYEWGRTIRYAVEFINRQPLVTKTGIIGVGDAATPLWQVLSADCGLSAAVVVGNIGWKGYSGINKFGENTEPQFDDNALKYIAGIEPQAYAMHVKCPLLVLSATNSLRYDIDRAYDTVSRVNEKYYHAIDYSVGNRKEINGECFRNAEIFFKEMLFKEKTELPKEMNVKGDVKNGVLTVDVLPDGKGLKKLVLYCSKDEIDPKLREWERVVGAKKTENGGYTFSYSLHSGATVVTYFVSAVYDCGLKFCSAVNCKKIQTADNKATARCNVYYNSRTAESDSGFYPAKENLSAPTGICLDADAAIKNESGALDIVGLTCKNGLLTFKPNLKTYKPTDGAMIMADVFLKGGGVLQMNMVTDYFGEKTVYSAYEKIYGDLWQNVRFESNKFKTSEGKTLKSFADVQAVEIFADGEFLINNLLWV